MSVQASAWPSSGHAVAHLSRTSQSAPAAANIVRGTTGPKREIFGFALASSLSDPTVGYPSWNFSALSTVAFFGLHINTDGTIAADAGWSVWTSSSLTGLVNTAHAHGVKAVVTIVLQDFSPGTPNMCAGLASRATTVAATVGQVNAMHVDGVNIDYEGLNGTCPNGQTSSAMMTDFVYRLRSALPAGSYLSVDTYASSASDPLGFFDIAGLNPYVDSFFVMAYDLEYSNYRYSPPGCVSFCLGPTAPLTGYYFNDTSTASQYMSVVGPAKVILGVPYYGRKACVGGVAPNAYPTGTVTADTYLSASGESTDPNAAAYSAHRDANDPSGQERWDTWFNSSLGCTRELYWDDVTSLNLKYDLVNRDGLRGVGIWNLNYGGGAPELWSALLAHFGGCSGVTVAAAPVSPTSVGTSVTFTAAASGCASSSPSYAFWVLAPGAASWQMLRGYSTSPSLTWPTAGLAPGRYLFNVWVSDAGSPGIFGNGLGRWDAYGAFTYVLTPVVCTGVTASFSPSTSALAGAAVTVTSSAAGCPNPRYELWLLPPGSATWLLAQGYSANPVFSWKAWSTPGTYGWSIWARDASSPGATATALGSWDAYTAPQYTVVAPCTSVIATASPSTAAGVGSKVVVTAGATGCPHPVFEFFLLPPGSSTWLLAQAYAPSATYTWNTGSYAAGTYQISVWARDANSPGTNVTALGSWDAYRTFGYSLFTPCSSVSLSLSPSGSAKTGSAVTATANATGCPNPQYQFWVLPPGSSTWLVLRAYGAGASVTWTSGPTPGSYRVAVWARDAASPGTSSNALGTFDSSNLVGYSLT